MVTEPYFNADDNFIHRCCECGEEALFGYGVSLRRGRLGTWYCTKHKPQTMAADLRPAAPANGPMAARLVRDEGVAGSNPATPTSFLAV